MLDLLRDPIWQLVLGLVVLLAMFFIFRRQTHRKQLSYKVITAEPVISIREKKKVSDLHILYKGDEVSELNLRVIKIINDGNVPIRPEDFMGPALLEIVDPQHAKIVDLEVIATHPDDLFPRVEIDDQIGLGLQNCIRLNETLLNSGDWLKVKALIAGPAIKPKPLARIVV